ncbi:MAG TPA: pyrroline-5-carboxylate reductase [Kiritimatiellae bacterium]|nr:pyrroline-5-carboxylate reductase [Kiritimatiellia bacterium]
MNHRVSLGEVGFIGAGNMAEALVGGMLEAGVAEAGALAASDMRPERRRHFTEKYNIAAYDDNRALVRNRDMVVLCVKPQQVDSVLEEIAAVLDKSRTTILSIAAGIPTARIEHRLGEDARVVRAMPNTPALIRQGAAAICAGKSATDSDMARAETLLGAVGIVVTVKEELMNAVTAVSGSGPAYVFYLMEAMIDAARQMGMDDEVARRLVVQTVKGAGMLCEARNCSPEELRAAVTSKGGTTAAALLALSEGKVIQHLMAAIKAAHRRAEELARG